MAAAMPIAPELETRALTWPEQARAVVITNDESNTRAGEMLRGIKALRGEIADTFGPLKQKAHEAHKAICDEEKKSGAPLDEAERILKGAMGTYYDERERKRRIESARLEREARERDEAQRLEEAAALEAAGQHEEAERVLVEAPPLPAYTPPAPVAKVAGVAMKETWSARVVNLQALVKAVAEGKASPAFLTVNQSALDMQARSLKGTMAIPGVEAVRQTGVAARR